MTSSATPSTVQTPGVHLASNGHGDRSSGGYGLVSALIIEIVLTAVFLYIILGATDDRAPRASPRSPSAWG
jgi:glycerol uptake facilitator-like aquaporin